MSGFGSTLDEFELDVERPGFDVGVRYCLLCSWWIPWMPAAWAWPKRQKYQEKSHSCMSWVSSDVGVFVADRVVPPPRRRP